MRTTPYQYANAFRDERTFAWTSQNKMGTGNEAGRRVVARGARLRLHLFVQPRWHEPACYLGARFAHPAWAGRSAKKVQPSRTVKCRRNVFAVSLRLAGEEDHVAEGVGGLLLGVVSLVDGLAARWLPRVDLDRHRIALDEEAHQRAVCARAQSLAEVLRRQRVERPRDLRALVPRHLRLGPGRRVEWLGRCRAQRLLLDREEVFARQALRAGVAPHPVLRLAPPARALAALFHRAQPLAAEAVVAHRLHRPPDPAFVLRTAHPRRVDVESACLRVLEKRRRYLRVQRVGDDDDRLGVVGPQRVDTAARASPSAACAPTTTATSGCGSTARSSASARGASTTCGAP